MVGSTVTVGVGGDGGAGVGGAGVGGAGVGGAGVGGAGGAGGGGVVCPEQGMVAISLPEGGAYCIDAKEVTNAEYGAFVTAAPPVGDQDAYCLWNMSFAPSTSGMSGCDAALTDPVARAGYPVVCVDWCDAFAYCKWKGKHLCGKIGASGVQALHNAFTDSADETKSEWYNACSAGGMNAYPYGDAFDPTRCRVSGPNMDIAGQNVECEGGYKGLLDMSGNVNEWENSCKHSDPDACHLRGGAFWFMNGGDPPAEEDLRCDSSFQFPDPKQFSNDWGFRCCG